MIEHPDFQRLRRISQTGLSHLVYPGAVHSRFQHAIGAMHLMQKAIVVLREKSIEITEEEELGSLIAILLHDIGHGPFSHALEHSIATNIHHETISLEVMRKLNLEFNGRLEIAIQIFTHQYHKKFLSQLISSQIDVDRLDYLKRDSFYSGVIEGNINSDRIISMMNVYENHLVIDEKGIYSVEKFLISRMFMYWQVYLHKTSMAAEIYLTQVLKRAKYLIQNGTEVFATTALLIFLKKSSGSTFRKPDLHAFLKLDDVDILSALKVWQNHPDFILSELSKMLINRTLPKVEIRENEISQTDFKEKLEMAKIQLGIDDVGYFVHSTPLKVSPYQQDKKSIYLLTKNKTITPIQNSAHNIMLKALLTKTQKYHLCYLDSKKILSKY